MFTVSQTAINSVLRDIETGNTDYVDQFFAARPDWKEQDDKANTQTDMQQEKEEKKA